jgi:hypothetical protein
MQYGEGGELFQLLLASEYLRIAGRTVQTVKNAIIVSVGVKDAASADAGRGFPIVHRAVVLAIQETIAVGVHVRNRAAAHTLTRVKKS